MLAATRRLLLLLLLHLAFFVCFPDTGPFGLVYGWGSFALWCLVVVLTLVPLEMIGSVFPGVFLLCDLVVLCGAGWLLAATMPQADRIAPYEKIQSGRYPTRADIRKGLAAFGVDLPKSFEQAKLSDINIPKFNLKKDKK
ncbi:MAG: hypothetical protein PHP45_09045 [Elusimicrobiales bacterium]|nr:hypothetical protein [Elusimicrobiales bacterium]